MNIIINNKLILIALLLTNLYGNSQNDSLLNMFRTLHLQNDRKVQIQSNIDKIKDISVKRSNDRYCLKNGSYGSADSIYLEVNQSNQIVAISFQYKNDTAYKHELPIYKKFINSEGKEFQFTSKDLTIKATKWEGSTTIFELIEVQTNNKKEIYSVIFDKELYFKKAKGSNLAKNDNSIELLKRLGAI